MDVAHLFLSATATKEAEARVLSRICCDLCKMGLKLCLLSIPIMWHITNCEGNNRHLNSRRSIQFFRNRLTTVEYLHSTL